jgi:hypothetical protein
LIVIPLLTAVFVVAVLVAKDALAAWWKGRRPASPDDVVAAVREACAAVGLNADAMTLETDLLKAGRVHDVLHLAGARLGKDVELRTVGDVVDWLLEAPRA